MKNDTPHDVPTHQLKNSQQYITNIGRILRKISLDGHVIIRQTTGGLEDSGFRKVSPNHFHAGYDLFSYTVLVADLVGKMCQSA